MSSIVGLELVWPSASVLWQGEKSLIYNVCLSGSRSLPEIYFVCCLGVKQTSKQPTDQPNKHKENKKTKKEKEQRRKPQ